jgi:hypothetical protein
MARFPQIKYRRILTQLRKLGLVTAIAITFALANTDYRS